MPEPDAPSRNEPTAARTERYQLPVPVPRVAQTPGNGITWFARMLRALFGRKPGSIRAALQVVLEAGGGGETGFSPEERAMLKNILGLRERRVEDVMVPRADIVAVQQDIPLGELVKIFEGAAHSRLVVYDDTLDDPAGMVHIRDLIAFMVAHATQQPSGDREQAEDPPEQADLNFANI